MTFFENILKKRLGDATSTKGIAPDDLWAAIEQELPPEEEVISSGRWRKFGLAILGLAVAIGLVLSTLLREADAGGTVAETDRNELPATLPPASSQGPEKNEGTKRDLSAKSADQVEAATVVTQVPQDNIEGSGSSAKKLRTSTLSAKTKVPARNQTEMSTPALNKGTNSEFNSGLIDPNGLQKGLKQVGPEHQAVKVVDNEKTIDRFSSNAGKKGVINASTSDAKAQVAVEMLDFGPSAILPLEKEEGVIIENFTTITPVSQLRWPRTVVGVFVGTNILRHEYPSTTSGELADVLNASRGEALGQSAALEFGYRLRPGLKVYTGVELLKTHTTFRYTQQWDTVTMYNGRLVDALATRRVQHNNRQTLISVPLMLEKTFNLGRLEAGLAAGLSFNYLTQQTGRSLNAQQQVVTYSSGNGTDLPAPDFYLAYQIRPTINYRLNSQISLQARADFRWQRYGKSALHDLSANAKLYGGSFGLVFGL